MRRRLRREEPTGELNVVPYLDIVTNLVMFVLLSMTGLIGLGVVNVSAPRVGGDAAAAQQAAEGPKLLLTVAISRRGFHVAGAAGVPGADAPAVDPARPPTVPLKPDGGYDFDALNRAMQRVKELHPRETNVIFSADGDVPYETLIRTMDACREARVARPDGTVERRPLFFDVSLSLVG